MASRNIVAGHLKAVGYESITISTTAKKFTDSQIANASRAIITIEDAQLRYRYDGANPTSSEGHLVNPLDVIIIKTLTNIKKARFIRKGSTDAKIRVTFEA